MCVYVYIYIYACVCASSLQQGSFPHLTVPCSKIGWHSLVYVFSPTWLFSPPRNKNRKIKFHNKKSDKPLFTFSDLFYFWIFLIFHTHIIYIYIYDTIYYCLYSILDLECAFWSQIQLLTGIVLLAVLPQKTCETRSLQHLAWTVSSSSLQHGDAVNSEASDSAASPDAGGSEALLEKTISRALR